MGNRLILAVVLLVVTAVSTGFRYPERGGVLRVPVYRPIRTIDPVNRLSPEERMIGSQVFIPLFRTDRTGGIKPCLVKNWKWSGDFTSLRLELRKDVRFHNGKRLKAGDVAFSLQRFLAPGTSSPRAGFFRTIKGADDYREGRSERLEGISVTSEYSLVIDFVRPSKRFISLLAGELGWIVPEGTTDLDEKRQVVGAGPFKFIASNPHLVSLARFEDYFEGEPYLEEIRFQKIEDSYEGLLKFELGDLDLYQVPFSEIPRVENDAIWSRQIRKEVSVGILFIGLNMQNPKISGNGRLRTAILQSIDNTDISEQIYQGGVVSSWIVPEKILKHSSSSPLRSDYLAARDYLRSLPEIPELEVVYPSNSELFRRIASVTRGHLASAGFKVTIREIPVDRFAAAVAGGEGEIFIDEYRSLSVDPYWFLEGIFQEKRYFGNLPVDEEGSERMRTGNIVAGNDFIEIMERKLLERWFILPISQVTRFWISQPGIQNFTINLPGNNSWEKTWIMRDERGLTEGR